MGYGNIAIMTSSLAMGQNADTPRRPSSAGNISDSSGSEVTSGGGGAQSAGGQSGSPFRPGQVRVDDSRGTEVTSTGGAGGQSGSPFRPGQVRVDDTRGTERASTSGRQATVPSSTLTTTPSYSSFPSYGGPGPGMVPVTVGGWGPYGGGPAGTPGIGSGPQIVGYRPAGGYGAYGGPGGGGYTGGGYGSYGGGGYGSSGGGYGSYGGGFRR